MNIVKLFWLVIAALALLMTMVACHAGILPDPKLTPGVTNPDVTQDTIKKTICVSGWTKTVRPPTSYTNALKRKLIKDLPDKNLGHYELDHNLSLQLGGAPRDPKNLWMQAFAGKCGARRKDVVESKLKRLICR